MALQLVYTSAPRGLRPGSQGFATVASTPGIKPPLQQRLEALSAYERIYEMTDPKADQNPVCYAHLRVAAGGERWSVLSRIAPAGADYTGRSNSLAHHLLLEDGETSPGGPAHVLNQRELWFEQWDDEPRQLSRQIDLPGDDPPTKPCHAWERLTGDAGWGGVLPARALEQSKQPLYIIYPAGADALALAAEALALLPQSYRWRITFSTYFFHDEANLRCDWRFLPAANPQAKQLHGRSTENVIDLTADLGTPPAGPVVDAARAGVIYEPPRAQPAQPRKSPAPPSGAGDNGGEYALAADVDPPSTATEPPLPGAPPPPPPGRARARKRTGRNVLIAASVATLLALAGAAALLAFTDTGRTLVAQLTRQTKSNDRSDSPTADGKDNGGETEDGEKDDERAKAGNSDTTSGEPSNDQPPSTQDDPKEEDRGGRPDKKKAGEDKTEPTDAPGGDAPSLVEAKADNNREAASDILKETENEPHSTGRSDKATDDSSEGKPPADQKTNNGGSQEDEAASQKPKDKPDNDDDAPEPDDNNEPSKPTWEPARVTTRDAPGDIAERDTSWLPRYLPADETTKIKGLPGELRLALHTQDLWGIDSQSEVVTIEATIDAGAPKKLGKITITQKVEAPEIKRFTWRPSSQENQSLHSELRVFVVSDRHDTRYVLHVTKPRESIKKISTTNPIPIPGTKSAVDVRNPPENTKQNQDVNSFQITVKDDVTYTFSEKGKDENWTVGSRGLKEAIGNIFKDYKSKVKPLNTKIKSLTDEIERINGLKEKSDDEKEGLKKARRTRNEKRKDIKKTGEKYRSQVASLIDLTDSGKPLVFVDQYGVPVARLTLKLKDGMMPEQLKAKGAK